MRNKRKHNSFYLSQNKTKIYITITFIQKTPPFPNAPPRSNPVFGRRKNMTDRNINWPLTSQPASISSRQFLLPVHSSYWSCYLPHIWRWNPAPQGNGVTSPNISSISLCNTNQVVQPLRGHDLGWKTRVPRLIDKIAQIRTRSRPTRGLFGDLWSAQPT